MSKSPNCWVAMHGPEVTNMANDVLNAIRRLLTEAGVPFREVHHEPTYTSEESAKARGEELRSGGKALLLKTEEFFRFFVWRGDGKLNRGGEKKLLGVKKPRSPPAEEWKKLPGLARGSVPPFGPPILTFELFV